MNKTDTKKFSSGLGLIDLKTVIEIELSNSI